MESFCESRLLSQNRRLTGGHSRNFIKRRFSQNVYMINHLSFRPFTRFSIKNQIEIIFSREIDIILLIFIPKLVIYISCNIRDIKNLIDVRVIILRVIHFFLFYFITYDLKTNELKIRIRHETTICLFRKEIYKNIV